MKPLIFLLLLFKVSLTEHALQHPVSLDHPHPYKKTCNTYYCNLGTVNKCVSKSSGYNKMNIKSAVRGRQPQDLMSKKQRIKINREKKMMWKIRSKNWRENKTQCRNARGKYNCKKIVWTIGRNYLAIFSPFPWFPSIMVTTRWPSKSLYQ